MLALCLAKEDQAQAGGLYIDSIKKYIRQVDSLIVEYSSNAASGVSIARTAGSVSNAGNGSLCATAELFKDGKSDSLYRLSYAGNCDSMFRLQDYYFSNNKIVFIRTVRSLDNENVSDQYYFNDVIVNPVKGELYLQEGYDLLKKISH